MLENFLVGLAGALFGIALIVVMSALMALPVMWLWNGVGPNLFVSTIKPIDFWNAWGLLILCGVLFKGSSSSSSNS